MWVARDEDGSLYLYGFEPTRNDIDGTWYDWDDGDRYEIISLDESLPQFRDLKWEDDPVEVDIIIL